MRTLTLIALLATLTACGKKPEVPKPGEPQSRAETEAIRNVEALGYSGATITDKVDDALDANELRKSQLDAAMDAQTTPK